MKDLVSIITPTFNSEKYISETIKSIQAQTHTNWELLITDDCSTDNTVSLINSIRQNDDRIKLFVQKKTKEREKHVLDALMSQRGILLPFVILTIYGKKINLKDRFKTLVKKTFIYSAYWTRNEFKVLNPHINVPPETRYQDILKTCHIYTSTVLISKIF